MDTCPPPEGLGALDRAIQLIGLSKLAIELGVRYQLIQGWRKPGRKFATPAEYCIGVERATAGRVTRHELRPSVWPELVTDEHPVPTAGTGERAA